MGAFKSLETNYYLSLELISKWEKFSCGGSLFHPTEGNLENIINIQKTIKLHSIFL